MSDALPEEKRQEIFLTLVEKQDAGIGVEQSRNQVADEYNLDSASLREIEREGMTRQWPPLSEEST